MKAPLPLPRFRRRAFTLLELLIVVVVIGILASLALIRFGSVQEKAYRATMQSDLRNFATARAIHLSEDGDASTFAAVEASGFSLSEAVFNAGYQSESSASWSLLVGHNKTATTCVLSTLATNGGAHRIECAEDGNLAFSPLVSGNTVTVNAGPAIAALAFAGEASLFSALAATDADIQTISWSWGDGTHTAGTPEQAKAASHTYTSGEKHTITLTLVKKSGMPRRGSQVVELGGSSTPPAASTNAVPVSSFTLSATTLEVGETLTFNSTATDADGDALTYSWSFGGSGTSSSASGTRTYSAPGTYQVTLTVSDGKGGSHTSAVQTVTVSAARTSYYDSNPFSTSDWTMLSGSSSPASNRFRFADNNTYSYVTSSWNAGGLPYFDSQQFHFTLTATPTVHSFSAVVEDNYVWRTFYLDITAHAADPALVGKSVNACFNLRTYAVYVNVGVNQNLCTQGTQGTAVSTSGAGVEIARIRISR